MPLTITIIRMTMEGTHNAPLHVRADTYGMWPKIAFADREDNTTELVLSFLRSELLYDVANYCYMEADVMDTERYNGHVQHHVSDITNEGNVDRVTRTLMLAFSGCVELLYPYTREPVSASQEKIVLDDTLKEDTVYKLKLDVPDDFSRTSAEYLVNLIHEYLVCTVIADYFLIVYPEMAAKYRQKADCMESGIREAKARRTRRVRRTMSPF